MTQEEDRRSDTMRSELLTMYFRLLAAIAAINTAMLVGADSVASRVFHLASFLSLLSVFGTIMNNQSIASIIHEIHDIPDSQDDVRFGEDLTNDERRTSQHITLRILLSAAFLCAGVLIPNIRGVLFSIDANYIFASALGLAFLATCFGYWRGDHLIKKWNARLVELYEKDAE